MTTQISAQGLSSIEQEVWNQELKYWGAVRDGDIKTYIDLYHDEHSSWPSFVQKPESKDAIEPMLYGFIETVKKGSTKFNLTLHSIDIQDEFAFVYYLADWSMETRENEPMAFSEKFLHIWKLEDGKWKLFGGMSAM